MSDVGGSLLITGMQRSGTTLLDKLLSRHPDVSVLSQPFPLLFVEVKRAFLREQGVTDLEYPLGAGAAGRGGTAELERFLDRFLLDGAFVATVFATMEGYSGQYTKPSPDVFAAALASLPAADLAATASSLWRRLGARPQARICGGKETLVEELLPHFLARGGRGLIVVRDPRDVVASLNHGTGALHGGSPKPTLFNVRNWRQSIALALHLAENRGFTWLRYEDLVREPIACLDRLANALEVAPLGADWVASGVVGQEGQQWDGNSSHQRLRGITSAPVGSHRRLLPPAVTAFIEATCLPELELLGYPVAMTVAEACRVVGSFVDPYPLARPVLARFASDPAVRAAEQQRLRGLGAGDPADERFPEVDRRLRAEGAPR